ncbi:hypothetical protein KSP40_PGU022758 [Platanthera guangdongensis]|uniref:Uncharacterized protein n=1 Tax=Platanthera guangdongensis TaxID=2320717 RepID=A0ABR2M0Q8_9ASPA
MWTASSLPSLSYKQHQQPLLLPPSTPYAVSCLAPPSISGTAEYHCLGRRTRSKTWVGTIVQCSIGTPNLAPAFCPLTRPSRRLLPEMDDHDCRCSRKLIFLIVDIRLPRFRCFSQSLLCVQMEVAVSHLREGEGFYSCR